jgi:acetyl-CoA synthetase
MLKKGDLYFPRADFKKKAWLGDKEIYKTAAKDPVKFWEDFANEILWQKKWEKAYEHNPPYIKWFLGGKLNITENIFERDFAKIKDKPAVIWEPEPVEEQVKILTYKELLAAVNKFSNALLKLGVRKGDRVGIYMPMVPETIISMLACARIGAVHAVIFSAFSAEALKYRLENLKPKILISVDGYYRRGQVINLKNNVDKGTEGTTIEKVVVVKRMGNEISWNENKDLWYGDLVAKESENLKAEVMDSEDLLFVLPESGTSGQFLPVMHTVGGYTVYSQWTGKAVLDLKSSDVLWCGSDAGWITGHTYAIYSPLLNGAATLICEGAPDWPVPDRWAQIIEKHKVTIFYTAPTALRMFGRQDKNLLTKHSFKKLRLLGSVGEAIDESTWLWYFENIGNKKCPIVDTWWQTETGGILTTSLPGIGPFKPSFTGLPLPGVNIDIIDESGKSCPVNKEGDLVVLPPFPPAMLRGIYNNEKSYIESYWSKYGQNIYFTSDAAFREENGLIRIVGRVDDVLKVAGHRIATGELENAVAKHKDIAEVAVVGVPDEIKGEVPVIFAVAKSKRNPEELKSEIIEQIKKEVGPIALPKEIYLVLDLPKTRSSKIMRLALKRLITKKDLGDISSMANPESLEKIRTLLGKDLVSSQSSEIKKQIGL